MRGVVRGDSVSVADRVRPSPRSFGEVPERAAWCERAPVLTVGNDAASVERMLEDCGLACPLCRGRPRA